MSLLTFLFLLIKLGLKKNTRNIRLQVFANIKNAFFFFAPACDTSLDAFRFCPQTAEEHSHAEKICLALKRPSEGGIEGALFGCWGFGMGSWPRLHPSPETP